MENSLPCTLINRRGLNKGGILENNLKHTINGFQMIGCGVTCLGSLHRENHSEQFNLC